MSNWYDNFASSVKNGVQQLTGNNYDETSARSVYSRIYSTYQTDPYKAQQMMSAYKTLQVTPTSKYYNPYSTYTNKALDTLKSYGIDTSKIDDNFYKQNDYLRQYLKYNGQTNTPSSPGAKASDAEKAAYAFYQVWNSEASTKKAEQQWADLQKELSYWAQRKDRNYSDDYIINNKIDWSKYSELTSMDTNKLMKPNEYNRTIGYSKDAMYGVLWAARNGGSSGSLDSDIAMSVIANNYKYDKNIAKMLDPTSAEYLPYATGSTNIDDAAMHFGVLYFPEDWTKTHAYILNTGTDEDIKMYRKVQAGEENARNAEKAANALNQWIDKTFAEETDPNKAKQKLDKLLKSGKIVVRTDNGREEIDLDILNKMDKSMGIDGEPGTIDLLPMTRGVNYKYASALKRAQDLCARNAANPVGDGGKYIDYTSQAWYGKERPSVAAAVRMAQDEKLREAGEDYDLDATTAERDYIDSSWSSSYDDVKGHAGEAQAWANSDAENKRKMIESSTADVQKSYAENVLGNYQTVYDYENKKQTRDYLQEELNKIAPDVESRLPVQDNGLRTETVTVGNESYKVTLNYDRNRGYYIDYVSDMSGKPIGNIIPIETELNRLVNYYNSEAEKLEDTSVDGYNLSPEDSEKLNTYKNLKLQIEDCDNYLIKNENAYNNGKQAIADAQQKFLEHEYLMEQNGLDTASLYVEDVVFSYLVGFANYEATDWSKLNSSETFREAIESGYDRNLVYSEAEKGHKELVQELEDAKAAKQYIEELGANIPGDYMKNLDRHIAKLERNIKDYEYFFLSKEKDFAEMVEKGKEMEYEGRPMIGKHANMSRDEYFDELANYVYDDTDHEGNIYSAYGLRGLGGMLTRYISEDEKDIYYYLMAKGDTKSAVDYITSLTDMSYGVLHTRATQDIYESSQKAFEDGNFGTFIGQNALAVLAAPISSIMSAGYGAYSAITGKELNPNNVFLMFNNYRTATREESAQAITDWCGEGTFQQKAVQMFYEVVSNRLDSAANALTLGGGELFGGGGKFVGVLNEMFGASPMGATAAMDAMMQAKRKGANEGQMWTIGASTFLAETATEAIELGHMKGAFQKGLTKETLKSFLKDWFTKAGLSEAIGESLNDIIENSFDSWVMGEKSEHSDRVWQYRLDGYNKTDAEAKAFEDEIAGVVRTAIMSYLSPGLDIVSYGAGRAMGYFNTVGSRHNQNPNQRISQIVKDLHNEKKEAKDRGATEEHKQRPEEDIEGGAGDLYLEFKAMEETPEYLERETERLLQQDKEQKSNKDGLTTDYQILESAERADTPTQTATIAATLDIDGTDESSDMANAAAAKLNRIFGEFDVEQPLEWQRYRNLTRSNTNALGFVKRILFGASFDNVDSTNVKRGLIYAALGGNDSASYQLLQTAEFRSAAPNEQAQMLAEAGLVDAKNETVAETVNKNIYENRVAEAMKTATLEEEDNKIDGLKDAVRKAELDVWSQQYRVNMMQQILEAASNRVADATDAYKEKATAANKKQRDAALHALQAADNALRNNTGLKEAQDRLNEAQAKLRQAQQDRITNARQRAMELVNQADAQRQQAAQELLNAETKAAEQKAEQENIEVAEEVKTIADQEQLVRAKLQEIGYEGEALERQVSRVMDRARQNARGREDVSTKLSADDGDKFLRKISRLTGITYEKQDLGDPLKKRGYIVDRNHMVLNSNLTKGQALVEAALHEVTHGIEGTKAYANYASFVINAMYGDTTTSEQYKKDIETKMKENAGLWKNLSYDEQLVRARQEIVADYARLNLNKKEFVRGITSHGLGGKFRDMLSKAISMLRGYNLDAEGKAKYQELRTAMKLLNEAINERAKHVKESNNGHTGLVQASISGWTDATGLTLEVTDDESHVYKLYNNGVEVNPGEYTADMVKGTPVGNLIDMAGKSRVDVLTDKLKRGKITQDEFNKQLTTIANTSKQQREFVAQIINMIGQYQDAATVWELAGSLAFSCLKENGDKQYSDSYDFGTICTKTQAILNAISEEQIRLGRALTKEEIDGIVYEEVGKGVQDKNGKWIHGATPCPPCYVYASWVNKPARLENVRQYQLECADWSDEDINNFMNRPDPVGKNKTETTALVTAQNSKKLWISLCLADEVTDKNTGETTWVRKENPDICPNEILLDLRRGGDMAIQHPGTWAYMQKGGNSQGKAIAPYSDARLGESIVAKSMGANKANAMLLEDQRNANNPDYIPQFLNPFLSTDPNDMQKAQKYFENAIRKVKAQNLKGGQRWQSWSDFRAEWGSDYLMEMITMQALGSQVQTYTKVVEALDLLASAGFEVNMSLMPYGDGFWHNEDGSIKVDENGNLMLRFSPVTGINPDAAEAYAKKYGLQGNVQPMVVGISDEHIKAALAGDYITFVIPFHGSGGSVNRLQHLMSLLHEQMETGNDYTNAQTDKFESGKENTNPNWLIRERIITGDYRNATDEEIDALDNNPYLKKLYEDRYINEDSDAFGVFFSKDEAQQIFPYEYWDTNTTLATADKNSDRFIDYCRSLGVIPRFSGLTKKVGKGKNATTVEYANFSGRKVDKNGNVTYEPVKGYWKLLIDRSMYNRVYDENGNIVPEKCTYHKPKAVSTENINVGAMPVAANNTVGHKDDETRQIVERIDQRIAMTSGQNEAAGSAVNLRENAEILNKALYEGADVQDSSLGDLSESEMDGILKAADDHYMESVENGDMKAAQKDVDYAAEQAGYTVKAYHGTTRQFNAFRFTSDDLGIHLGTKGQARMMAGRGKDARIIEAYVKLENPIRFERDLGAWEGKRVAKELYDMGIITEEEAANALLSPDRSYMLSDEKATKNVRDLLISKGYDGFVYDNDFEGYSKKSQQSIAVFNPNQIKSAETVTYDRNGNVIPPSERFSDSNDIRYSSLGELTDSDIDSFLETLSYDELFGDSEPHTEEEAKKVMVNAVEDIKDEFDPTIYNGRLYLKPETLDFWLSDSGYSNSNPTYSKAYLTSMDPADFLRITTATQEDQQRLIKETVPLNNGTDRFGNNASLSNESNYQPIQLRINETKSGFKVVGHEGRHRSIALSRAGVTEMPVFIVDETEAGKYGKTRHETATLIGQNPEFNDSIENGNTLTLADLVPVNPVNRDELMERFTASAEERSIADTNGQRVLEYSSLGDLSNDEMDNLLSSIGITNSKYKVTRPLEGRSPWMATENGPAQRQFGSDEGMLQSSNEIDEDAKTLVNKYNAYFPDTNAEQVARAIRWIKSNKLSADSDGFNESLNAVTNKYFNYMSADGQARMIAVMGMAVKRNDVMAQVALADAFNRQGTDIGRALQARKIFRMMTPAGRIYSLESMMQKTQEEFAARGKKLDLKFSDWVYEMAAAAENEEDFRKVQKVAAQEIANQIPANWKDRVRSLRMLAMLGNPRTHVRNIMGNLMFVPVVGAKNKIAAIMELSKPQGERTKTASLFLNKDIKAFAKEDAIRMKDVLTGEAKYNENNLVSQEQKAFHGLLQAVMDFNSGMLEKEDWWFLKPHYTRALGGWMQANGYTVDQVKSNPALLEQGRNYAVLEAQKATYRDFNELAKRLNDFVRNPKTVWGKAGAFVVEATLPFKKTPINILRRGVEYSPLGLMKALTSDIYHLNEYNKFMKGELDVMPDNAITPNQFIDDIASGLTGTGIMAMGFLLSSLGILTCGKVDDDDPEKEQGVQKYAIKILGTDFTYTIDWAAPVCIPLFVGAALQEEHEDMSWSEFADSVSTIAEPVFNLSMLDGLSSVFKTSKYDDTDTLTQIGVKIGTNYVSSYWPSLFGAIARTVDGTRRKSYVPTDQSNGPMGTVKYAWESLKNKIPGASQTSIPMRDIWGEEETSSLAERVFENFLSPGYIQNYKNDPILNEMSRLHDNHVEGSNNIVPGNPPKSYTYQNNKYVFSDKEYDEVFTTRGQTAHDLLTQLMNSSDYKNADDAAKVEMINSVWSYAKKVALSKVIPNYDYDTETASSIAEDGKINNYKSNMLKSMESNDWDGFDTMVEALYTMGADDNDIKGWIRNKYMKAYKSAYKRGDNAEMARIETILDNSGFVFDVYKWEEQVDEKYGY